MSKLTTSKALLVVITLSLLVVTAYPVFAQDAASPAATRKQLLKEKLETRKDNLEAKKESVANRIEVLKNQQASKAAALKLKLQAFKNQEKATAAARISENLNKVNQNQTSQMQKMLALMSTLLEKLENRVNQGTSDIKDPVSARVAIASAKEIIATASAAVTAQAQKDYTITVSSESRVKTDAKLQRDKLHTDLQAVRKAVIDAKQAVTNAIRIAKSEATTSGKLKEGTVSGQQ